MRKNENQFAKSLVPEVTASNALKVFGAVVFGVYMFGRFMSANEANTEALKKVEGAVTQLVAKVDNQSTVIVSNNIVVTTGLSALSDQVKRLEADKDRRHFSEGYREGQDSHDGGSQ